MACCSEECIREVSAEREQVLENLDVRVGRLGTREAVPRKGPLRGLRKADVQFATVGVCEGRNGSTQLCRGNLDSFGIGEVTLGECKDLPELLGTQVGYGYCQGSASHESTVTQRIALMLWPTAAAAKTHPFPAKRPPRADIFKALVRRQHPRFVYHVSSRPPGNLLTA